MIGKQKSDCSPLFLLCPKKSSASNELFILDLATGQSFPSEGLYFQVEKKCTSTFGKSKMINRIFI